jgi:hypothetical protein
MAITPAERLNQFIADDRIVRGKEHGLWRGTNEQGRETASLLAAFAEGIDNAPKFPAGIMPEWMVYFTTCFNEFGSLDAWIAMIRRYGTAALGWHILDEPAWRRCLAETMIAALCLAGQNEKSGFVYRVRSIWMRVAMNDEPNDSEWNAAALASWAEFATIIGVTPTEQEPTPIQLAMADLVKTPPEALPALAARRAAQQGRVSAPPMEAAAAVMLAVSAWDGTRPETAAEAAATAWSALAQGAAKKEGTWRTAKELAWGLGLMAAYAAVLASAWVTALALAAAAAASGTATARRHRKMAALAAEAKAASTAWALEAMMAAAQQRQKAWDQITAACLSAIETEIARAA